VYVVLLRPFGFIASKQFKIMWSSNLSIWSVPYEGCSRNLH